MATKAKSGASLEREVIAAVIILYVLICGVMLAIHYLRPGGSETKTSSTSPSHEALRTDDLTNAGASALTQVEAHTLLTRQGYQEIRGLRADGENYIAQAIKSGRMVDVTVARKAGAITDRVAETR